jgi:AAA+ superfamily predicted ATPase
MAFVEMAAESLSPRTGHYSPSSGLPIGSPVREMAALENPARPRGKSTPAVPAPLQQGSSSPQISPAALLAAATPTPPPSSSSSSLPSGGKVKKKSPSNVNLASSSSSDIAALEPIDMMTARSTRNRVPSISSIVTRSDAPFVVHSHHSFSTDSSRRLSVEIFSVNAPTFDPLSSVGTGKVIQLNIGGRPFTTTSGTLLARGANYFSGLLSGNYKATVDQDGSFFIDRNPDYFVCILEFLRTGKLRCPPELSIEALLEEAHFYSVQLLIDALSQIIRPIPRITFEEVAGYSQIKAELKSIIDEVKDSISPASIYSQLSVTPAKCLLFYGPLGCGKSQLAAAFANYCKAELVLLDPQDPHFVSRLDILTQVIDWTVVFFREFDAILSHPTLSKTVVAFVDRIQENPHLFVIARSCRPAGLWESPLMTPGRIDQRIYVPLPDEAGRQDILQSLLHSVPLASPDVIHHTAAATHGYSAADLRRLCQVMCRIALREYLDEQAITSPQKKIPPSQILVDERHMKRASQVVRRSEIDRDIRVLPSVGT